MHAMQALKQALSVIDSRVPRNSKVVFFEYPTYLNVGDLLIMHGSEAFFADRGYQVLARYSDRYCSLHHGQLPDIDAQAIILMQGGGNFGDLYPVHQRLREQVIQRYPHNRIVILPQTAWFDSAQAQAASAAVFRQHPDVHILARDSRSLELFRDFTPQVDLCPDMAHMLWDIYPRREQLPATVSKRFFLMRTDKEQGQLPAALSAQLQQPRDWRQLCNAADRFMSRRGVRWAEAINRASGRPLIAVDQLWLNWTTRLIARINQQLLQYDEIVTSRMHGHILACLLGLRTQVLDNSYGKNAAYFEHWTHSVPGCQLVPSSGAPD